METQHKAELKQRMKSENKQWEAVVVTNEHGVQVVTPFNSKNSTIENVMHKVELDLMTNLHFGFINPIQVAIQELKIVQDES